MSNDKKHGGLNPEDLNQIKSIESYNQVVSYLKHKTQIQFSIGDVLIKQFWSSSESKWKHYTVSRISTAPKKYMYVYENEHGVGFVKSLKVNGTGFTDSVTCLADVDFRNVRFIVDPDYQDHLIIGEDEFEHNNIFKEDMKERNRIHKLNKILLAKTDTLADVNKVFNGLKVGDDVWLGKNIYEATENEYSVASITFKNINSGFSFVDDIFIFF